jgi:hypothetical protein
MSWMNPAQNIVHPFSPGYWRIYKFSAKLLYYHQEGMEGKIFKNRFNISALFPFLFQSVIWFKIPLFVNFTRPIFLNIMLACKAKEAS